MTAPALVPATLSITMPARSSSSSTPMCAKERAPPPARTSPIARWASRADSARRLRPLDLPGSPSVARSTGHPEGQEGAIVEGLAVALEGESVGHGWLDLQVRN